MTLKLKNDQSNVEEKDFGVIPDVVSLNSNNNSENYNEEIKNDPLLTNSKMSTNEEDLLEQEPKQKLFADKKMNKVLIICGIITVVLIVGMIAFAYIPIPAAN